MPTNNQQLPLSLINPQQSKKTTLKPPITTPTTAIKYINSTALPTISSLLFKLPIIEETKITNKAFPSVHPPFPLPLKSMLKVPTASNPVPSFSFNPLAKKYSLSHTFLSRLSILIQVFINEHQKQDHTFSLSQTILKVSSQCPESSNLFPSLSSPS